MLNFISSYSFVLCLLWIKYTLAYRHMYIVGAAATAVVVLVRASTSLMASLTISISG